MKCWEDKNWTKVNFRQNLLKSVLSPKNICQAKTLTPKNKIKIFLLQTLALNIGGRRIEHSCLLSMNNLLVSSHSRVNKYCLDSCKYVSGSLFPPNEAVVRQTATTAQNCGHLTRPWSVQGPLSSFEPGTFSTSGSSSSVSPRASGLAPRGTSGTGTQPRSRCRPSWGRWSNRPGWPGEPRCQGWGRPDRNSRRSRSLPNTSRSGSSGGKTGWVSRSPTGNRRCWLKSRPASRRFRFESRSWSWFRHLKTFEFWWSSFEAFFWLLTVPLLSVWNQ